MTITASDLLHDADLFRRVYPEWPHGGPAPEFASPARVIAPVLDETSDAARCEDCAHLPGHCDCPHYCSPRGI